MKPASLVFNERRNQWELWYGDLAVVGRPEKAAVVAWAGRHGYSITDEDTPWSEGGRP
jgi:hypothetical protein